MVDLDSINRQYDGDGCAIARGLFSADQVTEIDAQIVEFSRTIGPTLKPGQIAYEDGPRRTIKSIVLLEDFSPYFAELRAETVCLTSSASCWAWARQCRSSWSCSPKRRATGR